ncbi:flippase [Proteiniphilum sp.]|uniref:flippase n=1 Tax=Proteiniphilum sp. TaxID=1926877 RepID=UPI0033290FE1
MKDKLSNIYRKVKNSKDSRTLIANFGYLSLLQVAGYIFPLITIPYLARVIGVDSFGKIAFASAVVVWFQTVADWGFNFTATRDVAKNRDNREKVSEIFSNVLWARMFLMLISFALLMITIYIIPTFQENKTILLISFLLIPGHILYPDWFFQAVERMKYITILNLLSKLLFTVLIFVFIKEKSDFILQPLFNTLGFLVSGIIAMYVILFRWKIKIIKPNISTVLRTIKGSTDVFINNIVPNLYNSFSVMLLGFYGGAVSNGIFDAGSKFVGIAQQFIGVIARAFFPFLSRRLDKHNIYVQINIYVSLILTLILFLLAPWLIKAFFTEEFYPGITVLRIMSFSVFFISIRNAYGTHYMILKGYEKDLRNLIFYGSFVGFILSFPLIYNFSFIGAAINIVIAQSIMAFLIINKAKKIK